MKATGANPPRLATRQLAKANPQSGRGRCSLATAASRARTGRTPYLARSSASRIAVNSLKRRASAFWGQIEFAALGTGHVQCAR